MRNQSSDSGQVTDYRDWGFGLTKKFRALKVWFVMRSYGIDGLKKHIRNHIELGDIFHSLILSRPDLFRVITKPAFAVVLFTVVPPLELVNSSPASNPVSADAMTKEVHNTIKQKEDILLLGVPVDGVYAIRVCCAIPTGEEKYIRRCFDIVVKTTEEVLKQYCTSEIHQPLDKQRPSYRPEYVSESNSVNLAEPQPVVAVTFGTESCDGVEEKMLRFDLVGETVPA